MTGNKKYYVNKDGLITIQCPFCEKNRTISVENFRNKVQTLKIKCSCKNTFDIDIEFRKYYRKKTNIIGSYRPVQVTHESAKACIVTDLSLGGLAIKTTNDPTIKAGDELIINFRLDIKKQNLIEKTIKVLHVDSNNGIAGGSFLESNLTSQDKDIYFYLK
jgi:hypothetical protein